jgi:hypothetical protein
MSSIVQGIDEELARAAMESGANVIYWPFLDRNLGWPVVGKVRAVEVQTQPTQYRAGDQPRVVLWLTGNPGCVLASHCEYEDRAVSEAHIIKSRAKHALIVKLTNELLANVERFFAHKITHAEFSPANFALWDRARAAGCAQGVSKELSRREKANRQQAIVHRMPVLAVLAAMPVNLGTEDLPQGFVAEPSCREARDEKLEHDLFRQASELKLSVRSANCLVNAGITLIGELVLKTKADLLKTKNFGFKSLHEIELCLAGMGLRLDMPLDDLMVKEIKRRRQEEQEALRAFLRAEREEARK